jgi:hypothetical protein
MTIGLFNFALGCIKEEAFIDLITNNFIATKKMKKQMIIYRKLINIEDDYCNNLYTKDLNLIANLCGFLHYMGDAPEHINKWLCDSIEESEKQDNEGIYLKFCNMTLKIKKMFEFMADYPHRITADDIFIDSTHIWVFYPV